jgi:protease I
MTDQLSGRKVAILAADGVERVELEKPRQAVEEAGASTELLSIHDGEIAARNNDLEDAGTFSVDRLVSDASVDDYDALLLPGGTVNPDKLRMNDDAIGFVRQFFESGKPIGTICHGPWSLVEAGVVAGRRITSFPSIRTDLRNAGAQVVDEEVVTDEGLVSSRSPDDLPAFCSKIVEEFAEGRHEQQAARTGRAEATSS